MDDLGLDTEGMASGDPGATTAIDLGKETLESKNLAQIKSAEDYTALPHGKAYLDPEGKKRFKPIRNKVDYLGIEEGAEYADPQGNIRTKPKYESIDFTPQTLFDMSHSDKGRKKVLEKYYPGKVRDDPAGGFIIEDEGGKLRKPGRGGTAVGGALAGDAISTVLSGGGSLIGGAVGTALGGPGLGTVAGGAIGAGYGGFMGSKFNDTISQLAGVYEPEGATEDAIISGLFGAGGDVGGRALSAAFPAAKEGARAMGRGAAKTVNKFLGTKEEALETGLPISETGEQPGTDLLGFLGLSKTNTQVPPGAIFKASPHTAENVATTFAQKFDKIDTYRENAERFMDKRAKDILASKDIGSIVEDSVVNPKAAVSTEKVGGLLKDSYHAKIMQESAEADARLEAELANRRAAVEATYANPLKDQARKALVEKDYIAAGELQNQEVKATFPEAEPTGNGAFKIPIAEGNGSLEFSVDPDKVQLRHVYLDSEQQGKGGGVEGYKRIVDWSLASGREFVSDSSVSAQASRMYDALARRGYKVVRDPQADVNYKGSASVAPGRPAFRITEGPEGKKSNLEQVMARRENVVKTAEAADTAARNLVQYGLKEIERQANDAVTVAQVGHNAGDLWRTTAESFVSLRRAVGTRMDKMVEDAEQASGGLVPQGSNELAGPAQQLIAELPEGFESLHPSITKKLRDIGGVVDEKGNVVKEPADATWVQLHNLRTQIRQDIKWNDLSSDTKNGALKFLNNKINEVLHPVEELAQPEIKTASKLLKLADAFYRENMGPLNNAQIKALVRALDSGLQADPKMLLKAAIKDGRSEVAETIKKTVGPTTWEAIRATDVLEMAAKSRQLDSTLDAMKFAEQIEDRFQNGLLGVLHGEKGAARLQKQALEIKQLEGKLPIRPGQPGDTANDIILRARSAAEDAKNLSKADPLKAMQDEMRTVEDAVRREAAAGKKTDPLAFLDNATVGANEAAKRILKDPDLIVAASRAFPGGEKSPEFELLRQIWVQQFFNETLDISEKLGGKTGISEETQRLMFPGISYDDMHLLAKQMKLLMNAPGIDFGSSLAAGEKVENPLGALTGFGKLVKPIGKVPLLGQGLEAGARGILTAYYNMVRGLLTSPSTLRWLKKGLQSRDPIEKEAARAELRAALQRGGSIGATIGGGMGQVQQQSGGGVVE